MRVAVEPIIEFEAVRDGLVSLSVLSMTGESLAMCASPEATLGQVKDRLAERTGTATSDFRLLPMGSTSQDLAATIGSLASDNVLTICMVRYLSFLKLEEQSKKAWMELAEVLQGESTSDADALQQLNDFLDDYPALINWQFGTSSFKPLLGYAVLTEKKDLEHRQQCIESLLRRGARVHIRHEKGFLLDLAKEHGSPYVDLLEAKKEEFKAYEKEAIEAWRDVSSKLCDETREHVYDEAEMARRVEEFCQKYPEMVNFMNNHACKVRTDEPLGYFRYAPLIAFGGAQMSARRRRGFGEKEEDKETRTASVRVLLKHGARMDVQHGGKTVLKWMEDEKSLALPWMQELLLEPAPDCVPFEFSRAR